MFLSLLQYAKVATPITIEDKDLALINLSISYYYTNLLETMMGSWVLLSLLSFANVGAFTFMKGWKVPKRDRGKRVAVEKFGDKSKLDSIDSRVVLISSYY